MHFRQDFADRQAEPGTVETALIKFMGYGEGNEQTLDFRFGDRVAAIVYREGRGAARGDGESQLYPSVLGCG